MDLQDIFVHVLLEVQDFVVKVRNYINIFSESFLNVTVSTKDQEIAFQDEKNNFGKVQPQNIFISLFCAGNRDTWHRNINTHKNILFTMLLPLRYVISTTNVFQFVFKL